MGIISHLMEYHKLPTISEQIILRQKQAEITEQCKAEIQAILDKYGCRLEVAMLVKMDGNEPQVIIRKDNHG
jgi:hypothetical protein